MRPQFDGNGTYLLGDCLLEIRILRVQGAAHREILPHHYTVGVTQVEEGMILIDISAPASEHVAVQIPGDRKSLLQMGGIPAVEGIHRSPVAAVDIYLLTIDNETESSRSLFGVGPCHVQTDRPESYLPAVRIDLVAIHVENSHPGIVQGRVTIAPRPPEIHVLQIENDPGRVGSDCLCTPYLVNAIPAYREFRGHHAILILDRQSDSVVQIQRSRLAFSIRSDRIPMRIDNVDRSPDIKSHISPQACAHQPWHYVPPIGVRGPS